MERIVSINKTLQMAIMAIPAILYWFSTNIIWQSCSALIYLFIQFVWILSVIDCINNRLSGNKKMNEGPVIIHLLIVFIILCIPFIVMLFSITYSSDNLLIVLGFLSLMVYIIVAIFFIYNFLSKLLVKAEQNIEVEFGKRIGEFVMFIFPFVGLYWLQPRILDILKNTIVES